jgi:hypothetical protein
MGGFLENEMQQQPPALPPPAIVMQLLLGRFVSQAIGAAAHFGYADHLAQGPKTGAELAALSKTHAPSVDRLLRALASLGVFAESEGRWVNTPLSETLREGVPGSVRATALFFNHEVHVQAWLGLRHAVETGDSGFIRMHGKSAWRLVEERPDLGDLFNAAMTSLSFAVSHAVVEAYDFAGVETLCDAGGGHGLLLSRILETHPKMKGILFDLPQVVAGAENVLGKSPARGRAEIVGGDFFASVPSAGAYIMKSILHDWSDADSVRILKNIHAAAPAGARLLLVESVIQPGNGPDLGKLIDLEMLVVTDGGRERTEQEWHSVLAEGGFELERVVPTKSPQSVIEARKR